MEVNPQEFPELIDPEMLLGIWKAESVFNDGIRSYRFEYILQLDPDHQGSLKQRYLDAEITSFFIWNISDRNTLDITYMNDDQNDEEVEFKFSLKENHLNLKYGGLLLNFTR